MRIDGIWRPIHDVHASAISLPSRDTRWKMLVGVLDPAVMLIFVFVLRSVRSRIAAEPELLDKLVFFLVVGELLERCSFFVGDDPANVLVHPLAVDFLLLS